MSITDIRRPCRRSPTITLAFKGFRILYNVITDLTEAPVGASTDLGLRASATASCKHSSSPCCCSSCPDMLHALPGVAPCFASSSAQRLEKRTRAAQLQSTRAALQRGYSMISSLGWAGTHLARVGGIQEAEDVLRRSTIGGPPCCLAQPHLHTPTLHASAQLHAVLSYCCKQGSYTVVWHSHAHGELHKQGAFKPHFPGLGAAACSAFYASFTRPLVKEWQGQGVAGSRA